MRTPRKSSDPSRSETKKDDQPCTLLLHVCCGPCATHVIDRLQKKYHLIGFFFNPNIHPEEEFTRRLRAAAAACRASGTALWVPEYRPSIWADAVRGREEDPEGGERCRICFSLRLEYTAAAAQRASVSGFATTLTVSPHKDADLIHGIGQQLAKKYGGFFLSENFKKNNGFQKSVQKSKELGLYRQRYCGCRFSR